MNHGELFILAIIVVAIAGGLVRRYMTLRAVQPPENPAWQSRIDTLERRVQTLERIVTDKGYDLKREFEKL
ncbi:MAG: hypothetical protein ACREPL_09205 [Rhodanobacteraceae bacterium]